MITVTHHTNFIRVPVGINKGTENSIEETGFISMLSELKLVMSFLLT